MPGRNRSAWLPDRGSDRGHARALHGPTDAHGRRLYPGGQPRGSELAWESYNWLVPSPEGGASTAGLRADIYLKYVGYPLGTPHSSVNDFTFTVHEFDRLTPEAVKGNAISLDLEKFRRSGGKVIIWHGWGDEEIPPTGTLDYYQRLWQQNGGLQNTQEWARVFMIPTMAHCIGGDQLTEFDPFRALVSWVERGTPPDRIIATARNAHGTVLRSRPMFPYPLQAKYVGTGIVENARLVILLRFLPGLTWQHDVGCPARRKVGSPAGPVTSALMLKQSVLPAPLAYWYRWAPRSRRSRQHLTTSSSRRPEAPRAERGADGAPQGRTDAAPSCRFH